MPLRDHFAEPTTNFASWEELHGLWPGIMTLRLNDILPPEYRCGLKVHLGSAMEIDVATFDLVNGTNGGGNFSADATLAWEASSPKLLLETEELDPPEYEALIYDRNYTRRLVAAVEIVSPGNKDRSESREAFVSKCHARLQQKVCVVIVDPVTERSANLYAELANRLGAQPPAIADASIYAVACRYFNRRVETWEHKLEVGKPLPTLPLWLTESMYVPLELERTYEETCRGLRIS